jgi:hypothetical protein
MPEIKIGKTARDRILEPYESTGQDYEFRSTPISSVNQFVGNVVDVANGAAFLVFDAQELVYFRTGLGERIDFGAASVPASDAETNLQKGGSTDGARDMAVEGITFQQQANCVTFFSGATALSGFGTNPSDPRVISALRGNGVICDPFGLIVPPQLQSPYLLEEAVFQQIIKHSTISVELDTSRPFKLGGADLCPASTGNSSLRASAGAGLVFKFDEGIAWMRDSKPDSDMNVRVKLHRPVVVPISLTTFPGGNAVTAPTTVYLRALMRLHGVSVTALASN